MDFLYSADTPNPGQATITGYTGSDVDVIIPDELDGYDVVAIGNSAFNGQTLIESIVIPDSVTSIGSTAFNGCSSLNNVNLGEGITSIGGQAFGLCISLTRITFPASLTLLDSEAFDGCVLINEALFNGDAPTFGSNVFGGGKAGPVPVDFKIYYYEGATGFTSPTWQPLNNPVYNTYTQDYPYTVDSGNATITGYTGVGGNIEIPSVLSGYPVVKIAVSAFYNKSQITGVVIPEGVLEIDTESFGLCANLTTVTLPESLVYIGNFAFNNCNSLVSINVPLNIVSIGNGAFSNCTSLPSISISSGTIGNGAFTYCTSLTSVTLSEGVTTIDVEAFRDSGITSIIIPNSANISEGTFRACPYLESVVIGTGVTSIPENAFRDCTSLSGIVIPEGVTSIGDRAFLACPLDEATIPDSVTSIGIESFARATFESIDIPLNVDSIGDSAFYECPNLVDATFDGNAPATFGIDVFFNAGSGFKIYYYAGATGWTDPWQGYPTEMINPSPIVWAINYPKLGVVGSITAEILGKANENGTAYFVILPRYSIAPSSEQVSLGVDASNLPVPSGFSGNVTLVANVEGTMNASNLSANADYDVYVVAMDEYSLQSEPVKIELTTKIVIVRQYSVLRRFVGSHIDITMSSIEVATSKDLSTLTIAAFDGDNYKIVEQDGSTITIKLTGNPHISDREIKIKVGDGIVISDEFLYKVSIIAPEQNLKSKPVSYSISTDK